MGFTIKSRLGRGRVVETFSATLEVEGDKFDVVVKRPRPEFKQNAAFGEALVAWGLAQREVEQENVISVLEAGNTDEGAYVLQEFVDGAPLSQVIQMLRKRKRTLNPSLAIGIADQIAAGLVQLHWKGIVHGGLDTGDVMLSYSGDVKVGDQGLRALDHHLGRDLVPEKDPYRAPEVLDISHASKESDIYSLGLITLEMLIGNAVWTADSMTIAGSLAAFKDFTSIGQAQPKLANDVVLFLECCLVQDPRFRISATDAVKHIEKLVTKHGLKESRSAIGDFVEALIPPPEADAAPTQMVDSERAEMIEAQHSRRVAHYEGKSVPLDPELEQKARNAIAAPSLSMGREKKSVPDVAKVAAKASSEFDKSAGRLRLFAIVGVVALLLLIAAAVIGGGDERRIRLKVSSVPKGADVYVDGDAIGATPIDQEVEVDGSTVQLRFKLKGYREHQVTIGTDAAELRYEAPLEKDQ